MKQLWTVIRATRGLLLSFSVMLIVVFVVTTIVSVSRQMSYTETTATVRAVNEEKKVRSNGDVERRKILTLELPASSETETSASTVDVIPANVNITLAAGERVEILLSPDRKTAVLNRFSEIYIFPIVTLIGSIITGITAFGMYRFTREPTEAELVEANSFLSRRIAWAFGAMILLSSIFFIVLMVFVLTRG